MRNLAYFRVGRPGEPRARHRDFWVTVNGNFIDQCVLEWCKLFGDKNGQHSWARVVSDPVEFEADLLKHLSLSPAEFEAYRIEMREYRDKFIAHLDLERVMNIPNLDVARASVEFYHGHIAGQEVQAGDLFDLPATTAELRGYYQHCHDEAAEVYGQL
jgi:hypothetical protein